MKQRLQKIISDRGITSRRKAEELIKAGLVTVNGSVTELGSTADPESDDIWVAGKRIPAESPKVYIMLNKPRGFVTTLSDEKGRKNAASLVADCGTRVYPIGRLDMDSEGLLLFTNDGSYANSLMHPREEVDKTYSVLVEHYSESALIKLREPIVLDGYHIRPPKVKLIQAKLDKATLEITIHEGRNRQIRRMCAAAGMNVLRLKRIREGNLSLDDLPTGKWRYLSDQEVEKI